MEKWSILFLNLMIAVLCGCQVISESAVKCDCNDKAVQDSLVAKYIDSAAYSLPLAYNDPLWGSYCDSVIGLCPNIALAYQQKALPFIKNGDYQKAFALVNKAVELAPTEYVAYRGFLKCIFTKDYEGAILDFQVAQLHTPTGYEMDHSYSFWLGLCNLELGYYSKAEQHFQDDIFIQTAGDSSQVPHFNTLFYMGALHYKAKNYPEAKKYLLECLDVYEGHPMANYYLGIVYREEMNVAFAEYFMQRSKHAFENGYGLNEDNVYYANYPHQIRNYEVDQALLWIATHKNLSNAVKDSLVNELYSVDENDQKYRNQMDYVQEQFGFESNEMNTLLSEMKKADSINLAKVSGIINRYGWLGYNEIGEQGNTTLFMVIQHADVKTQELYLPLFRQAVKDQKARARHLALLEDRVALLKGRRQIYGSQVIWNMKLNTFCVAPLIDPDEVDARRSEVGLPPLADYLEEMDIPWDVEQYKIELPNIEKEFFNK